MNYQFEISSSAYASTEFPSHKQPLKDLHSGSNKENEQLLFQLPSSIESDRPEHRCANSREELVLYLSQQQIQEKRSKRNCGGVLSEQFASWLDKETLEVSLWYHEHDHGTKSIKDLEAFRPLLNDPLRCDHCMPIGYDGLLGVRCFRDTENVSTENMQVLTLWLPVRYPELNFPGTEDMQNELHLLRQPGKRIYTEGYSEIQTECGHAVFLCHDFKKALPPMDKHMHKGQAGRIGVIGGCEEYTGAPYFAAKSSLLLGADLVHVFCDVAAAPVIKSYSPDLIVHPFSNCGKYAMAEFKYFTSGDQLYINWLSRLHALLVGPGMGRDHFMMETVMKFVKHAMDAKLPLIFDADGLHMLQKFPKLLEGYSNVVLTPNIAEFRSLCESRQIHSDTETAINELSATFNNAIIVLKGATDIIAQGNHVLTNDETGSLRRVGGQGDILSGTIATFVAWLDLYKKRTSGENCEIDHSLTRMHACFAASSVVKRASYITFQEKTRHMLASDVLENVPNSFDEVFDE